MRKDKPILKRQTGGNIPVKFDKPLKLEEIPTQNKIHVINNYSPNYDYIVEGDKIYYAQKGRNYWVDISDNDTARTNLYNFLGNNYDFRGYEDDEKSIWNQIKQGTFNYKQYREQKNKPKDIQPVKQDSTQQTPTKKQDQLVTVRVGTSGGGFTNIQVPEYMASKGQIGLYGVKPEYLSQAYQMAKEQQPERYADPINNAGNWLPFIILTGGRGLENMGYKFISPLVDRMIQGTSNLGKSLATNTGRAVSNVVGKAAPVFNNLTRGASRFLSSIPQNISNLLYSTPTRQALAKATMGSATVSTAVPAVTPYLKVENPGDIGYIWNNVLEGNYEEAREVFLNGISRKLEKGGENNDPVSSLSIQGDFETESAYGIRPLSMTGDTITNFPSGNLNPNNFYNVNKGRVYILPETLNSTDFIFGARNRGDNRELNTEAAVITSLNPFLPYGKHDTKFKNFIGIDQNGRLKVGDISNFGPGDKLAGTFANEIASFMKDQNGDFILSKSLKNPSQDQPAYVLWDNGKLINKPTGQAINILLYRGDKKGQRYGSIAGGRILVKVGNEIRLLSGSLKDIDSQFEDMKLRNHTDHGTFYTLDNGSFNKAIRTMDQKITSKDLIGYDRLNAGGGGNFLYISRRNTSTPKFRSDTIPTPNIRTINSDSYKSGHPLTNEQKGVVLHHTAFMENDLTGVLNHLTNPRTEASAHVVIGFDGTRKVLATPDKVTFHAGQSVHNGRENVNDFMIGIEFQEDTNRRDLTPQQIESAIEYLEPIIRKNNIRLEDIVTHQNVRDMYNDYAKRVGQKEAPTKPDINERNYMLILQALLKRIYYKK